MTTTKAFQSPPATQDVNLDLFGLDTTKWKPDGETIKGQLKKRQYFYDDGTTRNFNVTLDITTDKTRVGYVKAQAVIGVPWMVTDSVTGLVTRENTGKYGMFFEVPADDLVPPARVAEWLQATLDTFMPGTVTAGVVDPAVISSLMTGNPRQFG
jgi:hypothetical protein